VSEQGLFVAFCEHTNAPLSSVKGRYCWSYSRGLCFKEFCS